MQTTLSSKGQLMLPAEVRRRLRLAQPRRYKLARHPKSGLPVMVVAAAPPTRKVTAAEIARLHSELL